MSFDELSSYGMSVMEMLCMSISWFVSWWV